MAAAKAKAKRVEFSSELFSEICAAIAEGHSLREICQWPGMPQKSTVMQWLARDATGELVQQYDVAREMQAEAIADEVIEIADTEPDPQKARNRMDARRWYAGKMKPKKFGDRQTIDLSISDASKDDAEILAELRRHAETLGMDVTSLLKSRGLAEPDP